MPYDTKCDLWSIGIIIYVFLTGKFPFEGVTPFQLMLALNQGVLKFPPDIVLSRLCVDVIGRLLQVEPDKRISWSDFFAHPFVASTSEQYQEMCAKSKAAGPGALQPSASTHAGLRRE